MLISKRVLANEEGQVVLSILSATRPKLAFVLITVSSSFLKGTAFMHANCAASVAERNINDGEERKARGTYSFHIQLH